LKKGGSKNLNGAGKFGSVRKSFWRKVVQEDCTELIMIGKFWDIRYGRVCRARKKQLRRVELLGKKARSETSVLWMGNQNIGTKKGGGRKRRNRGFTKEDR